MMMLLCKLCKFLDLAMWVRPEIRLDHLMMSANVLMMLWLIMLTNLKSK